MKPEVRAPEVTFGLSPVSPDRGEKGDDLSTSEKVFEFLLSTTTSFRRPPSRGHRFSLSLSLCFFVLLLPRHLRPKCLRPWA